MNKVVVIFFLSLHISFSLASQVSSFDVKSEENVILEKYKKEFQTSTEDNPILHYNLGTAYLKTGDLGNARWHLEKAKLWMPNDADINQNLTYLKDKMQSPVLPVEPFFLSKIWKNIIRLFSPTTWSVLSIFFSLCLLGFLYIFWFSKSQDWVSKPLLVLCFALVGFSIIAGLARYKEIAHTKFAVVMRDANFLNSAHPDSKFINQIEEGTLVTILEKFEAFYKVQLADLDEGWIDVKTIKSLRKNG